MQYDNKDIKFVAPTEGLSLWSDNMLVPNKADHKANAEKLMDYYYDPEVAARLAAWVNYICPVAGRRGGDGEDRRVSLVGNPLIFPTEDDLAATWAITNIDSKTREAVRQGLQPHHRSVTRVGDESRSRSTTSDLVLAVSPRVRLVRRRSTTST